MNKLDKLTIDFIFAISGYYNTDPDLEFSGCSGIQLTFHRKDDKLAIGTISWDNWDREISVVYTNGAMCSRFASFGFTSSDLQILEYTHNPEVMTAASRLVRHCFENNIEYITVPKDIYKRNKIR